MRPFTEITVLDDAPAAEPEGVVVTVEANEAKLLDEKAIPTESYDPLKDLVNYRKPPVTLLEDYISDSEVSDEEIFENKTKIEETLKYFGIPIQRIKATVGPTVTLYEIVQAQGNQDLQGTGPRERYCPEPQGRWASASSPRFQARGPSASRSPTATSRSFRCTRRCGRCVSRSRRPNCRW